MDPFILGVIVGVVGGAFSSIFGWLASDEPFIPRKFAAALMRAAIGGVALAVSFNVQAIPRDLVLLFLACMGVDYGANKVAGAVRTHG